MLVHWHEDSSKMDQARPTSLIWCRPESRRRAESRRLVASARRLPAARARNGRLDPAGIVPLLTTNVGPLASGVTASGLGDAAAGFGDFLADYAIGITHVFG